VWAYTREGKQTDKNGEASQPQSPAFNMNHMHSKYSSSSISLCLYIYEDSFSTIKKK
jgi:hypothetical protein